MDTAAAVLTDAADSLALAVHRFVQRPSSAPRRRLTVIAASETFLWNLEIEAATVVGSKLVGLGEANGPCRTLGSCSGRRPPVMRRSTPMKWILSASAERAAFSSQRPQARLFRRGAWPTCHVRVRRHRGPHQRECSRTNLLREKSPAAGAPASGRQQPPDHRKRAHA
jgi:hypothetical protein